MNEQSYSVSVKGLALSYGAVKVLKQLDLDIPDGEFLVLLGPLGLWQVDSAELYRRLVGAE